MILILCIIWDNKGTVAERKMDICHHERLWVMEGIVIQDSPLLKVFVANWLE